MLRAKQSPVSMVELLHQPAAVGQSDLNVSDGLGGVEAHGGSGLGLIGCLVLLGGGWSCNQLRRGTTEEEIGKYQCTEIKQQLAGL